MVSSIRLEYGLAEFDRNPRYQPKYIYEFPFVGGRGDDTLVGNASNNRLEGRGGDDILIGRAGKDILDGGGGKDELAFDIPFSWNPAPSNSKGVFADLNRGKAVDYFGDVDKLISIEHAWGTNFKDELIGSRSSNDISGGGGNDKILGLGGDDLLHGGGGQDFLIGGRGNDQFLYVYADEGGDRIQDFKSGVDEFLMSGSSFLLNNQGGVYGTGELSEKQFFIGAAAESDRQIFGYNPANSTLLFDSNGGARGGVTVLATLVGSSSVVVASDIQIF